MKQHTHSSRDLTSEVDSTKLPALGPWPVGAAGAVTSTSLFRFFCEESEAFAGWAGAEAVSVAAEEDEDPPPEDGSGSVEELGLSSALLIILVD